MLWDRPFFAPKQKSVEEFIMEMGEEKVENFRNAYEGVKKEVAFVSAIDARRLFEHVFCDILGTIERAVAIEALRGKTYAYIYQPELESSLERLNGWCDILDFADVFTDAVFPFLDELGYTTLYDSGNQSITISWVDK
jgi:hypothetical protein